MLRRVMSEVSPLANTLRDGLLGVGVGVGGSVHTSAVGHTVSIGVAKRHNHNIGVLGIPFNKGQRKPGVSKGPESMRNAGLITTLTDLGLNVTDYGDVSYVPCKNEETSENIRNVGDIAPCMFEVSRIARIIQGSGKTCVAVGGDHSVAIGTLDATLNCHPDVAVVWVDAHADINIPCTSGTGNAHGMPVARLSTELAPYWPCMPSMDSWLVPRLQLKNVAYIGLRDVDEYERLFIEKFDVKALTALDVEKFGIADVMQRALKGIDPNNTKAIHLSVDVDALDPTETPSTGTPVRGGLTLREAIYIMEAVHRTGRLVAMDLVEFNPGLGSPEQVSMTADASLQIVRSAFGYEQVKRLAKTPDLPDVRSNRLATVAMSSQQ